MEDPMEKFKPCNEDQLVMPPISLQDQLVPGTLEHTMKRFMRFCTQMLAKTGSTIASCL
jgi:hypothetical protein